MNSKKLLITLLAFLLLGCLSNAQNIEPTTPESKYLFGGKTKVSGFISPMMETHYIDKEFAFGSGGGAAILFNQRFFFGAYGMGSTTADLTYFDSEPIGREYVHSSFAHGGFWMGGIIGHRSLIHAVASTTLGWGEMFISDDDFNTLARDVTFVATPQINLEMNVAKWFKINGGLGYRFAPGINNSYYGAKSLDGITYNFGMSFGWFGQKVN